MLQWTLQPEREMLKLEALNLPLILFNFQDNTCKDQQILEWLWHRSWTIEIIAF